LIIFLKEYNMPVPPELVSRDRKRILIVDDEKPVLSVISRTISHKNSAYEIETAEDGFEAGRVFSEFKPHLIILDVKLPGLDGNAIVHHGVLDEGLHFIQKPFNINKLLRTVRHVLDSG